LIALVETLRFRCLRHVRQPLGHLEVLAGSNGSGKTAFLDALRLVGRLVASGVEAAVAERAADFRDLVWMREPGGFELALEAPIPPDRHSLLANPDYRIVRYEVALGPGPENGDAAILEERVLLRAPAAGEQPALFEEPSTILTGKGAKSVKTVIHKGPAGNDNFYDENGRGWDHAFRLGHRRSALGHLPDDEAKFPVTTWLRDLLAGLATKPEPAPVAAAVPGLWDARGARICFPGGFELPVSEVSEGVRRLLALARPDLEGVLLLENPESGLHPCAVEWLFAALERSRAQVLMATHSPVILERAGPRSVLLFSLGAGGAAEIARAEV
jgi:hypothetical protein